jgi:hypothetical protein
MDRARLWIVVLSLAVAAGACEQEGAPQGQGGGAPEPQSADSKSASQQAAERSPAERKALERARGAAKKLGKTLKERLLSAMADGGAEGAVQMCSTEAQKLTAGVTEQSGVQVGRSSLRLRNPENEGPAWVMKWLRAQGERKAEGVTGFARVVDTGQGARARVLKPLAVQGPCLNCHGPRETLPEGVRKVLSEQYPEDEAVGYALGDLRGALWAAAEVGGDGASAEPVD